MLGFDGLVASHNHGLNDIFGRAAARKVVDRSGETLHNWACSHSAGEALYEFVGDVSGLEVREYKHIGTAGYFAARSLAGANRWHESSIGLKFAVDVK